MPPPLPFVDLAAQRRRIGNRIERAIGRVLDHGQFILGPEVTALEDRLADFTQSNHCVTCANGTDALKLVLMAEDVGTGSAVFVPSFTFVATGEVVPPSGATLMFVDVVEDTFTLDPCSLEAAVAEAKLLGLTPRMVIAVDLFGQPADYDAIGAIAAANGMIVVDDAAQALGAVYKGRRVGSIADYTTVSFFPAKPLGCYGDGGAVFTDDADKARLLRSLRFHGQGNDKYENIRIGLNSRLDTIQAAVLLEKLAVFPDEVAARNLVAQRYSSALADVVTVPLARDTCTSVWAQYTVRLEGRDSLAAACTSDGIPTAIYYPVPMHRQSGYRHWPFAPGGLQISERLSDRVLSLPIHAYLDEATQDRIIETVRSHFKAG